MFALSDKNASGPEKFVLKDEKDIVLQVRTLPELARIVIRDFPDLAEDVAHNGHNAEINLTGLMPSVQDEFRSEIARQFTLSNAEDLFPAVEEY